MRKESWTDKLRQKLAEHQETPPEGLWDDISASLDTLKGGKARVVPLRKWAAAAAVTALLAGGGIYWWNSNQQPGLTETVEPIAESVNHDSDNNSGITDEIQANNLIAQNTNDITASADRAAEPQFSRPVPTQSRLVKEDVSKADAQDNKTSLYVPEDNASSAVPAKNSPSTENVPADMNRANKVILEEKKTEKEILKAWETEDKSSSNSYKGARLNLYASNNVMRTDGFVDSSPKSPFFMAPSSVRKEEHHDQPLSFGLTLSYPLSNKVSLSSGVVYTRLKSDFSYFSKTLNTSETQILHYIGVPLNVQFNIWGNGKFNSYALGGGQADFNFKAKTEKNGETYSSEKDDVQFSATLGVGAQYNFLPFMGVYVEPTAKYYFDNESDVSNAFKEHPLKFNLQTGLRFIFK